MLLDRLDLKAEASHELTNLPNQNARIKGRATQGDQQVYIFKNLLPLVIDS
jgi:hypothetical protein